MSTSELEKENSSLNSYREIVCGPLEVQLHLQRERRREGGRERESAESVSWPASGLEFYLCVSWLLSPA